MELSILPKALLFTLFLFLSGGCQPLAAETGNGADGLLSSEFSYRPGMNRGDFYTQRDLLRDKHWQQPTDDETSIQYAKKLFEIGDFSAADRVLNTLPKGVLHSAESMLIAAEMEYCEGRYGQAEILFKKAYDLTSGLTKEAAGKGLVLTYYQSGQYQMADQVGTLPEEFSYLQEMMKQFGSRKPFEIDWRGNRQVELPFLMSIDGNLPIIAMKVNGRPVNVLIDTGCDNFDLDESVAAAVGLKAEIQMTGQFAGGLTADILYGVADSVEFGGLKIQSVPVAVSQIEWEYVDELNSRNITVNGIIGIGILQRFLATMDYPGERLILRPKGQSGHELFEKSQSAGTKLVKMPFVMADTHFMLAKGAINGQKNLNMFLDSGLQEPEAAILLEKETLDYVGIPVPEKNVATPDGQGGLGGSNFSVGEFQIADFHLGQLHRKDLVGLYGVIPNSLYFGPGLIVDGIISHNFLKKYQWTIDFDSMEMIFIEPTGKSAR